jgi:RNA polymerase sigma-70 factor, ECF subfamily
MYRTIALSGPPADEIMTVSGAGTALAEHGESPRGRVTGAGPAGAGRSATDSRALPVIQGWPAPRSEGQDEVDPISIGGAVGTDAGAETGPYRMVTETSGTGARRAGAEQLFAAHYPKLAGWVRRLVDDDETAHEIASEAFVRLLSKWTSPDKLDSPQSYLYMIATNLVRDHWRKAERERRAMSKAAAAADADSYTDPSVDVDIRELIAALPTRLREPFLLHYYAGFGVKEIAVQLKRPEGTIKADLYHARAKLKEAIKSATGPLPVQRPGKAAGEGRGLGRANAG